MTVMSAQKILMFFWGFKIKDSWEMKNIFIYLIVKPQQALSLV